MQIIGFSQSQDHQQKQTCSIIKVCRHGITRGKSETTFDSLYFMVWVSCARNACVYCIGRQRRGRGRGDEMESR